MSEYIKREAAKEQLLSYFREEFRKSDTECTIGIALDAINATPAADVEPVVRCKNCEYSGKIDSIFQTWCKKDMRRVNNDFYCAHGKEKLQHETD